MKYKSKKKKIDWQIKDRLGQNSGFYVGQLLRQGKERFEVKFPLILKMFMADLKRFLKHRAKQILKKVWFWQISVLFIYVMLFKRSKKFNL